MHDNEPEPNTHITDEHSARVHTIDQAQSVVDRLRRRLRASIIGRDGVIDSVIVALLADGHVLLEDYPGSGKTTLAKALGDCLVDDAPHDGIAALRRIQFTPDMLPGDVTGSTIFDPNTNRFHFRPGPIFAHIVLADEINRTSPKVQSALLEAMAEKQTTVDNSTHKLDELFFVIATQNPLDLAGTFPLPVAQLDRFLFKIRMSHISRHDELDLLNNLDRVKAGAGDDLARVTRTEIIDTRKVVADQIYMAPAIREALVDIAESTRTTARAVQGVSTRSLVLMIPALKARALACEREFVSADDVEALSEMVLSHRIVAAPGSGSADEVVRECCVEPLERLARRTLSR